MSAPVPPVLSPVGFDSLYREHPDGVVALDAAGRLLRCNPRFEELTGYTAAELVDAGLRSVVGDEDLATAEESTAAALTGAIRRFRGRGRHKDGSRFSVEVTQLPVKDEQGSVTAVLVTVRETTRVEEAAEEAERSAGMMRIAGRVAHLDGWTIEAGSRVLRTSDDFNQVLGFRVPPGRPYTEALLSYSAPQYDRMVAAVEACLATGEPMDVTRTLTRPDGSELHVRTIAEAVRDESGTITRIQGAFYDITLVVEAERQRKALQERLQVTLSQIASGVFFFDHDWRFLYANETGAGYVQSTVADLLGKTLWELFPEAVASGFGSAYRRTMRERVMTRTREYYAPLDTWFEAIAYPTADGMALQLHDVTEDQRTRLQLQETTERLRSQAALLDAARDAIMVRGLDHRVTYWNGGAEQMFGWTSEEMLGRSVREVLYADPSVFDRSTAEVLREGFWQGEVQKLTRDGRTIVLDCRWQLVRDGEGNPVAVFAVDSDITEFREAEERRYRVQRMESLGTLAGGIAHDLNNVLTPILIAAQLLRGDEQDESRSRLLGSIETGAKRGADMIRQVLSFARGEEGQRRPVDTNALLRDLTDFCRDTLPKSVTITAEVAPALPPVIGDRTQLLQVLVNLITNANDAMPSGGTLVLRAVAPEPGEPHRVLISVQDSGCGMSEETAARIFEPFYTTKDQGRGTGLGLSTSAAIVRSHGGTLDVATRPGAGSAFTLSLPATSPADLQAPQQPEAVAPPQGAGELILVVDDEDEVRELIRSSLEGAGYRTLAAHDGERALEVLAEHGSTARLVVMDVMMPGLGARATLDRLAEQHPRLPVLLASGFDADNVVADRSDGARFLPKPFTISELLGGVREALDAAERRR